MTPEQQGLALGLALTDGETSRVSPEEFLRAFGEGDGQALAARLVADAVDRADADDLELSLIVAFRFGANPALLGPLIRAATGDWHHSHEDVVELLEELRSPESVDPLASLAAGVLAEVEDVDASTLATKATWALYRIGGGGAREALERVEDASADEDVRDLARRLLERMPED